MTRIEGASQEINNTPTGGCQTEYTETCEFSFVNVGKYPGVSEGYVYMRLGFWPIAEGEIFKIMKWDWRKGNTKERGGGDGCNGILGSARLGRARAGKGRILRDLGRINWLP